MAQDILSAAGVPARVGHEAINDAASHAAGVRPPARPDLRDLDLTRQGTDAHPRVAA